MTRQGCELPGRGGPGSSDVALAGEQSLGGSTWRNRRCEKLCVSSLSQGERGRKRRFAPFWSLLRLEASGALSCSSEGAVRPHGGSADWLRQTLAAGGTWGVCFWFSVGGVLSALVQNPVTLGCAPQLPAALPLPASAELGREVLWVLDAVQIKSYRCILAGLSSLGLMLLNTLNMLGNNPTKHPIVG